MNDAAGGGLARRWDVCVAAVVLVLTVAATWPLAGELSSRVLAGSFAPPIVHSLDEVPRALLAGENPLLTHALGAPGVRHVRYLGWVLILAALPLRPLGAVVTANLGTLLAPALTAGVMARWLRRMTPGAAHPAVALASFSYALAPHFVTNLGNGELAKAQAWLMPAGLLLAHRAMERWRALPVLAAAALLAGFTSPYMLVCMAGVLACLALVDWRQWRRHVAVLGVVGACLVAVSAGFSQPGPASLWIFAPTFRHQLVTPVSLEAPFAIVPLGALFWPMSPVTPLGLQHGLYLGWALLLPALWGFVRGERRGALLALVGVVGALGPVLFLVPEQSTGIPLPMALSDLLQTPLARTGMYYRLLHIALVGLALGLSRVRLPAWGAGLLAMVFAVEVFGTTGVGLPLPTRQLPHAELAQRIASDQAAGSVMDLPGWPRGSINREHAILFRLRHGRDITALPRMPKTPAEWNLCNKALDRCVEGGPCRADPRLRSVLEGQGVRFVVLHRDQGKATDSLATALAGALGDPEVYEGALLWVLQPASEVVPLAESCGPRG